MDVPPAAHISWFQAEQACVLAGKELCSNDQWQAAAAGTSDNGAFDGDGPCQTKNGRVRNTGLAKGICVSKWGAEDMIGNLTEWVTSWQTEPGDNNQWDLWGPELGNDGYLHGGVRSEDWIGSDGSHYLLSFYGC